MANQIIPSKEKEVTLIVVDNSWHMRSAASYGAYGNQLDAIDLYCHAKLKSNPKNAIGIYTMGGAGTYCSYLESTGDVDKIMNHLHKGMRYGGDLDISRGVTMSLAIIIKHKWRAFKPKRLFFVVGGGPSNYSPYSAKVDGGIAKRMGVAVDVVNFCPPGNYNYCTTFLDKLVSVANHSGNSHIKHIPPGSSLSAISEALSSSPPIITPASIRQVEIAAAAWKKRARAKEDKENYPDLKRKETHVSLAPPPPPPKVPRLKSLIVSKGI